LVGVERGERRELPRPKKRGLEKYIYSIRGGDGRTREREVGPPERAPPSIPLTVGATGKENREEKRKTKKLSQLSSFPERRKKLKSEHFRRYVVGREMPLFGFLKGIRR